MSRSSFLLGLTITAVFAFSSAPNADAGTPHKTLTLGVSSEQAGATRARVHARIAVAETRPGRHGVSPEQPATANGDYVGRTRESGSATQTMPPRFPPIASSAAVLRNPQPAGPQSFWYTDGGGHQCMYAPNSVLPCFTVVGPGATAAAGGLNPAAIAASVADRTVLVPGRVEASPSRGGLAGADSWFWLNPTPQRRSLSVTLAGESVTVTADPSVEWRFGDGSSLNGGPGVPYQPGLAPAGAVEHVYQTRCLPGDQGRDPYVLASCGDTGYGVEALVVWRISYQAFGAVATSGTLPTRTTASSSVYPVSEARAFLVPAGGAP